jgi:hypothetical protein
MQDNSLNYNHKIINLLLFLFSYLGLTFFLLKLSAFYNDDAYIVLRYAKNILEGNGLVWNIGEKIEGYSCFLWLMFISFLGYFHIDLVLASKLLGVFFALLTLALFFILERHRGAIGGLLLSTNSCFALWAVGGLETVAFGFFVFLACYLFLIKNNSGSAFFIIGIVFSLAAMTRPEGILFFFITILFCVFENKKPAGINLQNGLFCILGFFILYCPYFIWRLYYYGHLFPCTFYVKGGTNIIKIALGLRYIFYFMFTYGFPLLILLFIKERKKFLLNRAYLTCILLGYSCYILLVGGDHMQGFRFYTPLLPLFYLFIQEAFFEAQFINRTILCNLIAFILIISNFFVSCYTIPQDPGANREAMSHSYKYKYCCKVPDPAAYLGKCVGAYIKEHWPHNAIVAGNIAGSLPYFSDISTFIDMLGLNDYTIAKRKVSYDYSFFIRQAFDINRLVTAQGRSEIIHNITSKYLSWQLIPGHGKGDGKYVLSRKPDYIIIGPAEGDIKPWFLGDKEIISSPVFYDNYQLKQVSIKTEDKFHSYYPPTETGILTFRYYERKK